jgi:hypothetical protein
MYKQYLKYLLRHKYFVFVECLKRGLIWQGIIHDWSKFLPDEFIPYCNFFYGGDKRKDEFYTPDQGTDEFNYAWLKHQHRNPHHWQHWTLKEDDGGLIGMKIPQRYAVEMVCDWIGAGKAIDRTEIVEWYEKNREKIILHPVTREFVEILVYAAQ